MDKQNLNICQNNEIEFINYQYYENFKEKVEKSLKTVNENIT